MPAQEKFLGYRGDLRAVASVGDSVAFVTEHPEGQPTALFLVEADKLTLTESPLPCGGVALVADGSTLFFAGTDRRLYRDSKPLGEPFPDAITAIVPVANERLAVLSGSTLFIVSHAAAIVQSFDLGEKGSAVAADRTGQWLAVGTAKGTVVVFDGQDKPEFDRAESAKLHEGAVTALLFETEELRFFSTGADHKLLSTHARGALEPEDKGRDNVHDDNVHAMLWAPAGDRFITGGMDGVLKTWPRTGGVKPAKLDEGVGKVIGMTLVTKYNRPQLVLACADSSIRFVTVDDDGRFGEVVTRVYGAVDRAKNELGQNDPKRREKVLRDVAGWGDGASLDLIAAQLDKDGDHALRLLAVQLLAASSNPRAVAHLEAAVNHRDEKVRVEAFRGLQKHLGAGDFRPIDRALKTGKPDVGILAVAALGPLAAKDDQALARLTDALNAGTWDVRKAALASLETVFDPASPESGLTALGAKNGDVRAAALVRFYERKQLDDGRVKSAARRRLEDDDSTVRRVAFLLTVLSRPELANFLRKNDEELHRQINEIERSEQLADAIAAVPKSKLGPDDYDVPLQATAARSLDTCLRGARALAVLGDPRAFGLLIQLSREESEPARVEVCRALAALNDPRAVARLRSLLYDGGASVRDAAYSALVRIEASEPLSVAGSGLSAAAEDVRRRGLQTLVETIRKSPIGDPPSGPPDPIAQPAWFLLVRSLNDDAPAVRSEAWKAVLNLKVGGGGEPTLRFARQSVHADIRREVLTEVTAQLGEEWATPLLYEFFDDPDGTMRAEAFAQATRKTKEITPLEAAMRSRYSDTRRLAIDALIKKKTKESQVALMAALDDADPALRDLAMSALIDEDARPALTKAMANANADVRVRAATALAEHGDPASLQPLVALATAPEPKEPEKQAAWLSNAVDALQGLALLGDPSAVAAVQTLLESKQAKLRENAAWVLVWCARPDNADISRAALSHADPEVRRRAVLALAYVGDVSVLARLQSDDITKSLAAATVQMAAVAMGGPGDRIVANQLDHADENIRHRGMLIHLLHELRGADGSGRRCLECLSARAPRIRLAGAQAVELYADAEAFRAAVVKAVNDRGDETAWKIAPETVDAFAAALSAGPPWFRARAYELFAPLGGKEQAAWNSAWGVFSKRYAKEIDAALKAAPARTRSELTTVQLKELAFGAYVGLVREQGSSTATPAIVRVRQTALGRVFALATADELYRRAARPVFVQAMSDPNQPVRLQAFDHLLALGMDATALGAEALESGHNDLGVKGLELLSGGASSAQGDGVLENVMLSRTDNLAIEAAKLLAARRGWVPVGVAALSAVYEPLRTQAVQWIAAEYDKSPDAQAQLRATLTSRYRKVREAATFELAAKKDPAAFDALAGFLREAEAGRQTRFIDALTKFGDKRAAAAFLDRVENDPAGTAKFAELFQAAGSFRDPATADRLLSLAARKREWQSHAIQAALVVSGFDQVIEDMNDRLPDRKWEAKQFPRHTAAFAKLIDLATAAGLTDFVAQQLPTMGWCRGSEIDPVLASLTAHPDEAIRNAAIEQYGKRIKRRGAPADPLVKALKLKNPTTQFLAAEGLALAGRSEGINVLLSAIDYLEDVAMRSRAVSALGELGDARAVDVLLRLAGEDGNPLQEPAAEAIGHLKQSPEAEKIARLLERLASGGGGVAQRAIVGLRWYDSTSGWQLIRRRATDRSSHSASLTAAKQLGFRDDPANRVTLTSLIQSDARTDVVAAAFDSARRLWGAESLDPQFTLLQNAYAPNFAQNQAFLGENVLDRVARDGDALRIMQLFPKFAPALQGPLEAALLSRPTVPVKEATEALNLDDEGTVRLAARMIGRAGDVSAGPAVEKAIVKWSGAWAERRTKLDRDPSQKAALDRATECLRPLMWAAARLNAGIDRVAELAVARPDDNLFKPVRAEAVKCLATVPATEAVLKAFEAVALGTDPDARETAADVLARNVPDRAAKLIETLASDRPSFTRLVVGGEVPASNFLRSAVGQVHYQPVALPLLIATKDVDGLAMVARDRKKPEAARLGAIEGLGVLAAEVPEAVLVEIGTAEGDDEDVRKAAWKALRRSKRARKKAEASGG